MPKSIVQYGFPLFQESRDRRDGHGGVEEHDLVAPAPDRRGVPRVSHTATANTPDRASAQARQTGLDRPLSYQRHATWLSLPAHLAQKTQLYPRTRLQLFTLEMKLFESYG